MGLFDLTVAAVDALEKKVKHKTLLIKVPRSVHYKLQLICDDMNDYSEIEIHPEDLVARVIDVFVQESYSDSTQKLVRTLLPDLLDEKDT